MESEPLETILDNYSTGKLIKDSIMDFYMVDKFGDLDRFF